MRSIATLLLLVLGLAPSAAAEVTRVSITSRQIVADGASFGNAGPYEKLTGRIQFALDPAHPRNKPIVDLGLAPRSTDGRVYFTADLFVLQPVDRARGNGALLFDVPNRGSKLMLGMFNSAPAAASLDPTKAADFGDGFLLREGYTLVWVGWQLDVAAPALSIDAPRADLKDAADVVRITFIVDATAAEASPSGLPPYAPISASDPQATLSVRSRFWDDPTAIPRDRWSFVAGRGVRLRLEGGFAPGRVYELSYRSLDARVAGVGLAALRDAASAFRYRTDLPVQGRSAYAFGISQSGRFLRQFLADGFNADEKERRVFDAVWPHIAGAGLGSFNERFAMPGYSSFPATRLPFTDTAQDRGDGDRRGVLSAYTPEQQPKVFYTNSSVEYWGQGRAAALTHTSLDGMSDVRLPDHVRMYLLSGSQHGPAAFPPRQGQGQALPNPTPHAPVMRALLRALHLWVTKGAAPPETRIPRLADGTLVRVTEVRFPAIPEVSDPRGIEGPGLPSGERVTLLPFLVPQVDADGNEVAGIRMPDVAVPIATTTGWNFRNRFVGNPGETYPLIGSFFPFAASRAQREAAHDPRPSVQERYRRREDYVKKSDAAIDALRKGGYLLDEDLPALRERAAALWDYVMRSSQ